MRGFSSDIGKMGCPPSLPHLSFNGLNYKYLSGVLFFKNLNFHNKNIIFII